MSKIRTIKIAIVLVAVVVAAVLILGPTWVTPDDLPPDRPAAAQRVLAVFVICMALWLTNYIPLAATGLLAIALLPLLNILPSKQAFALFGNQAVFFILGVFLLAAAMIATGLSKRLTLVFLQRFDRTPKMLVAGVLLTSAFLALWMPEHAVAAMIFPIVLELTETLGLKKGKSDYAKMLFLALAWGSIIGGVGTILGGARAPLALGLLAEFSDARISFVGWMAAAIPLVLVMLGVAWIVLNRGLSIDVDTIQPATQMLDERVRRLGPMSGAERRLAMLGIATIATWIFFGHELGLGVIAVASASLLFLLQIADWRAVQDYVNWGILLMYGGAVALGSAMNQTHACHWLVERFVGPDIPPFAVLLVMATTAVVLTEGVSNSAAVAILLPIGYSFCGATGVDPVTMTLAVTIPAGLAFSLPISSPPNAICFSAGYYSVRQVVRLGIPMSAAALALFIAMMAWYWPMIGLATGAGLSAGGQ